MIALGVTQASEPKAIIKALKSVRLVDHIDAIVALATRRMTDQVLGRADQESANALGEKPAGQLRKADRSTRADLLLLAAVYGDPAAGEGRLEALRKTLNVHRGPQWYVERAAAFAGWALPAAALIGAMLVDETADTLRTAWLVVAIILGVAWVALVVWVYVWKKVSLRRLAGKIAREVRTGGRDGSQLHAAMEQVPAAHRRVTPLPVDADDDTRYALLDRLRGVLRALHCRGVIVIVDRVDEPTLINGDAERMRAVIWPLLNNKFLQQDGMGLKLLLPIELRHELFRETSNFFQEARLDKQSLVERLTWTGATLFDLCNARLNACRASNAEPISLVDLFEENVSRTDLIDALDQMHQPRDAFKLLYHCIQEHCANVTEEEGAWRIPRLTLETVRRQQAERVQMLYRGIAPA